MNTEFPGITIWPIMCQKSKNLQSGFDLRFIVTDSTVNTNNIIGSLNPGESIAYWQDGKMIARHTWDNIIYYLKGTSGGVCHTYAFGKDASNSIKNAYGYAVFKGGKTLKGLYKIIELCTKVGVKLYYKHAPDEFYIPFVKKELNKKLYEHNFEDLYSELLKNVFINEEDESNFISSCVNTGISACKAYKPFVIANN